jgi:hypothetical protein
MNTCFNVERLESAKTRLDYLATELKLARNSIFGKAGVFKESILIPLTLTLSRPGEGIFARIY